MSSWIALAHFADRFLVVIHQIVYVPARRAFEQGLIQIPFGDANRLDRDSQKIW